MSVARVSSEYIYRQAESNQFYNLKTQKWESLSALERLFRSIVSQVSLFSSYVFSAKQICIHRSWQSVAKTPITQGLIEEADIKKCFNDSRALKSDLNVASRSIALVYSRVLAGQGKTSLKIKEDPSLPLFTITREGERSEVGDVTIVVNEGRQKEAFGFYDQGNQRRLKGFEELLIKEGVTNPVASVQRESIQPVSSEALFSRSSTLTKILLSSSGEGIEVIDAGDPTTVIFREENSETLLALAIWSPQTQSRTNNKWSLTIIEQFSEDKKMSFVWGLLHHFQMYQSQRGRLPIARWPHLSMQQV